MDSRHAVTVCAPPSDGYTANEQTNFTYGDLLDNRHAHQALQTNKFVQATPDARPRVIALEAANDHSVRDIATAHGLTEIEVSQSPVEAKG